MNSEEQNIGATPNVARPDFWPEYIDRRSAHLDNLEALTERINRLTEQIRSFWAAHYEKRSNSVLDDQETVALKRLLDERDEAKRQLEKQNSQ